jgi:hypothetical protein
MKKLLIVAAVALGFIIAAAPDSKAGVSVGIGIGFPIGYYPPYYGYYPIVYPAPYYYTPIYYRVGFGPYYWWHGRRVYYRGGQWR